MYDVEPSHFKSRREELMRRIGPNGVAIIKGAPERTRSNDTEFPYRPSSDVLYLTGFREPEVVVVIAPGHPDGEFVLFVRERDAEAEVWNGRRYGTEGAKKHFAADEAFPIKSLEDELPAYLSGRETLFFPMGVDEPFDRVILRAITKLRSTRSKAPSAPRRLAEIRDVVHDMRVHKRPEEIDIMRQAASITADAHREAMRVCKPGMHEFEIQAAIEHYFRRHGAEFPAYTSIVGAAVNATILHYTENRSRMNEGDVVLIDAGCEFHFYAADITRSFPVSGKFTPEQRDVYQAVLDAQKAAIDDVKPGLRYDQLQEKTARRLTQSLVELKILKGDIDGLIEEKKYKAYYPHNVGHYLGIDVHDAGTYFDDEGKYRRLDPGMVITIEPGLYFPDHDENVPEALRGLGIRIEDDILVTESGSENLTAACPKEVADIEAIVGSAY